jgi:hypothetical protein
LAVDATAIPTEIEEAVNVPLPSDIRQFIAQQIESVAQLEALFLLRRESHRSWNAEELARHLYLSDKMCQDMLGELARRGYVAKDSEQKTFEYACADNQADETLGRLADLYAERRVAVIGEIYSNPISKVRTFAEAFRWRKDGDS